MRKVLLLGLVVALAMLLTACGAKTGGNAPVAPQPGARLSGPIEITGKASSATITLKVSDDGTTLTSIGVEFQNLKCNGFSAGSMSKSVSGSFAITGGSISATAGGLGEIKGRFTSPTEASGTANLTLKIPMSGDCALGEFKWSAKAQ